SRRWPTPAWCSATRRPAWSWLLDPATPMRDVRLVGELKPPLPVESLRMRVVLHEHGELTAAHRGEQPHGRAVLADEFRVSAAVFAVTPVPGGIDHVIEAGHALRRHTPAWPPVTRAQP